MALDTTPGSATGNSFATVAEFKTYRDNRLPAVTWAVAASDPVIEVALIMGGRLMNSMFDWTGTAVDAVQAMTWPRVGMATRNGYPIPTSGASSYPQALKDAQCEFALQLGAGDRVSDNDAIKQGITSVKAGSVAVTFKDVTENTSESVDMLIRRLGSEFNYVSKTVPDMVRQLLVESWFNQPSILRPIMFGAM